MGFLTADLKIQLFKKSMITISGTIKKLEGSELVAQQREVLLYCRLGNLYCGSARSDSNGAFSFEVQGLPTDEFRVVVVGESGENSQIFEHIMGV